MITCFIAVCDGFILHFAHAASAASDADEITTTSIVFPTSSPDGNNQRVKMFFNPSNAEMT